MLTIKPTRNIINFIASANQPIAANPAVNSITSSSLGQRSANFSINDADLIVGMVRSELAGSLTIYQGFGDNKGGVTRWVSKTVIPVSASAYSSGFVDGSGAVFKIDVTGEICRIDFLLTAAGPNNNFELAAWAR